MEQKIQLVCNMTNYNESKARERLEALGGDSEKVIREFMNNISSHFIIRIFDPRIPKFILVFSFASLRFQSLSGR